MTEKFGFDIKAKQKAKSYQAKIKKKTVVGKPSFSNKKKQNRRLKISRPFFAQNLEATYLPLRFVVVGFVVAATPIVICATAIFVCLFASAFASTKYSPFANFSAAAP